MIRGKGLEYSPAGASRLALTDGDYAMVVLQKKAKENKEDGRKSRLRVVVNGCDGQI